MKKILVQTFILLSLIVAFTTVALPHTSFAEVLQQSSGIVQNSATSGADSGGFWKDLILWIPGAIASTIILPLVGWLTTLSGVLLNYVVLESVVHMASNFSSSQPIGAAINDIWGTVRDVGNMFFIFILLYTAIMTMFGQGNYQKVIKGIVIAAILINFSLFFTKVVIDFGNLLALTFYKAIAPTALEPGASVLNAGISNILMNQLHVATIWKNSGVLGGTKLLTIGIFGSIFALIAAFVFFAVSILFIIRYVVLIFVLILSPLMFFGSMLPGMEKVGKQWFEALIGQTFFAPIYFFLTWIVIKLSLSLYNGPTSLATGLGGTYDASGKFVGSGDSFSIIMHFVVMIAFLIISLVVAKSYASKGGPQIAAMTKWATGFAGGSTLGLAGRFGRGTVGRAGAALSENETLKGAAAKGGITGRLARLSLAASKKTSEGSFDLRGAGALGKTLGAGNAQKGGFAKDMKNKIENEKKFADSLKPSDFLIEDAEKELKEAKKTTDAGRIAQAQREVDRLKGANEDELRKRQVRDVRMANPAWNEKRAKSHVREQEDQRFREIARLMRDENLSEEDAKKKAKETEVGWAPEEVKGLAKERKEERAKNLTTPNQIGRIPLPDTDRVLFLGKLKRENRAAAAAIRKTVKEKSNKDKVAEAAAAMAKEESEETGAGEATSTPPPTGGESAEGGREAGEGGGSRTAASE
ncbi:hypothetical protein KW785_02805 [Candidatus Parcubacteria bacterium]|nr:hypothetical protein [Candidatus Parcubacteria bacterium]